MTFVDQILNKLSDLIAQSRWQELETDGLEIKSVPAIGGEWKELHKTANAFLNARGGIILLGIKEEGKGTERRYVFTGWRPYAEPTLKQLPTRFANLAGEKQDLSDCFRPMQLLPFQDGQVGVVYVDELAADRKFVFYEGAAYKRNLTGDHHISTSEIDAKEAFKQEALHARELQPFLQLMELSLGYLLRNIQVGVRVEGGGRSHPQYPSLLLRETVNNALAHRDYSIDRQVILTISPGKHIAIRNPGTLPSRLLIEDTQSAVQMRRILPEAKPRNPKLADVLRVFRKWEGRGIGMATLVNLCLRNQLDLPYYRLYSQEVCLYLPAGRLLDDRMEGLFNAFDRYIEDRLNGRKLTQEQKLVLSYLIKSEWANEKLGYTILLTTDNNHFEVLLELERAGLIIKHATSTANIPVYNAGRVLMGRDYFTELRHHLGQAFDDLDAFSKSLVSVVFRFNRYSISEVVSAKQTSFALWHEAGNDPAISSSLMHFTERSAAASKSSKRPASSRRRRRRIRAERENREMDICCALRHETTIT